MKSTTNLDCLKNSIVSELFVNTADCDYVSARWSFQNGLWNNFFWQGLHAVEKYSKASLLLNQCSSIRRVNGDRYGHDIVSLLNDINSYYSLCLCDEIPRPAEFPDNLWHKGDTLQEYIQRLYVRGEPNNRYNIYGYSIRPDDLVKLDNLVFKTRRLCANLALNPFLGRPNSNCPMTSTRDLIDRFPQDPRISSSSKLGRIIAGLETEALRVSLLDNNFYFRDSSFEHSAIRQSWSSANPILWMRILRFLESEDNFLDAETAELSAWVANNIKLDPEDRSSFLEAARRLSPAA